MFKSVKQNIAVIFHFRTCYRLVIINYYTSRTIYKKFRYSVGANALTAGNSRT